jgi:hypothetical protein
MRGRYRSRPLAVLAAPAKSRSQIEARKKQVISKEMKARAGAGAKPIAKLPDPMAAMAKAHCAGVAPAFADRLGSRVARPRLASHRTAEVARAPRAQQAGHMGRRRDRELRRKAFAPPRTSQKLLQHFAARRREPAPAIAPIERRDPTMNRIRIARLRPERHLTFDEGNAKIMRETTIKEAFPDSPAREQSGLRCNALPAGLIGRGAQNPQVDTVGGQK